MKKPSDDHLKSSAPGNNSSMLQINRSQTRNISKTTTHQANAEPTKLSSFKSSNKSANESSSVSLKGARTIVYIENSPKLKSPASSASTNSDKSEQKEIQESAVSRPSGLKPSKTSVGRYQLADINARNNNLKSSKLGEERKSSTTLISSPSAESADNDGSASKTVKSSGLMGPRRSSGLRMLQGGIQGGY